MIRYFENKPKQKEYEEKSAILRREVYLMALASVHQFRITPLQ